MRQQCTDTLNSCSFVRNNSFQSEEAPKRYHKKRSGSCVLFKCHAISLNEVPQTFDGDADCYDVNYDDVGG